MADNLTIFGTTYSNVAGFKATDTSSNVKTFIRPSGSQTITQNNTYDVSNLAEVVVNVSGGGSYPWFGSGTIYVGRILNRTINLKNDTTYDSWTPSTTATAIKAASVDVDCTQNIDRDHTWWFVYRAYVDVAFTAGATLQNTMKRYVTEFVYWYYPYPSNESNLTAGTYNSITSGYSYMSGLRYYGNTAGTLAYSASAQYGPMYTNTISYAASSVSFGLKIGAINARCHATYFSTDRAAEVDSANTNMVVTVDVYKTPNPNSLLTWMAENIRTDMTSGL